MIVGAALFTVLASGTIVLISTALKALKPARA
jgi:hypothetical protein